MDALLNVSLPKHNLGVAPDGDTFEERDIMTSGNKHAIRSCVTMIFDVIDLETGYSERRKFFGADQDTNGKSLSQAITECDKRFKFKLFRVSSKETDPDGKSIETGKKQTFAQVLNDFDFEYEKAGKSFEATITGLGYMLDTVYQLKDTQEQARVYRELLANIKETK